MYVRKPSYLSATFPSLPFPTPLYIEHHTASRAHPPSLLLLPCLVFLPPLFLDDSIYTHIHLSRL